MPHAKGWFFSMIKREHGQALVEMALILPLILMIMAGIFDFGRMIYTTMNLHEVTEETVRMGSLGDSDTDMKQYAMDHVNVKDPSLLEVDITPTDTNRIPGQYVKVTLKYPMNFVTPIISRIITSPVILSTNSTMRVE